MVLSCAPQKIPATAAPRTATASTRRDETMRQLKRFAAACILIASLSFVALADGGSTQGPSAPAPGDGHSPGVASFGDTQCAPGEMNSPPGETNGPPCAADANPGET